MLRETAIILYISLKCVKISYEMFDSDLMLVSLVRLSLVRSFWSIQLRPARRPTTKRSHYNVIKVFYDYSSFICFSFIEIARSH